MNEIRNFTIPEHDFNRLSNDIKNILKKYEPIEIYSYEKIKDLSSDEMADEFKKRVREFVSYQTKHQGAESNEEGMCLSLLSELFSKMMIKDARKLELEKLLE